MILLLKIKVWYYEKNISSNLLEQSPTNNSLNQVVQQLNWVDYYGELENGTYRIVKSVGSNNISVYSNEFTIK